MNRVQDGNWIASYRGVLWGLLIGGLLGLASSANLPTSDPAIMLLMVLACWASGGYCGHTMQSLLK
jgi:hypothetical protein